MKRFELTPKFVERVPSELEEDTLYVCLSCDVIAHKCPCGCGEKVVLPISPQDWQLVYNGEVTLSPSIGNYKYPCKSHYFIRNNKVVWVS